MSANKLLSYFLLLIKFYCFQTEKISSFVDYYDYFGHIDYAKPTFPRCAGFQGICIQSNACPIHRILTDKADKCLQLSVSHVCCQVAVVRTPIDIFKMYNN